MKFARELGSIYCMMLHYLLSVMVKQSVSSLMLFRLQYQLHPYCYNNYSSSIWLYSRAHASHGSWKSKKWLLTLIIANHYQVGGKYSVCYGWCTRPFFPVPFERKGWFGYARLMCRYFTHFIHVDFSCNLHAWTYMCVYDTAILCMY